MGSPQELPVHRAGHQRSAVHCLSPLWRCHVVRHRVLCSMVVLAATLLFMMMMTSHLTGGGDVYSPSVLLQEADENFHNLSWHLHPEQTLSAASSQTLSRTNTGASKDGKKRQKQAERKLGKQRHVFFLKVHKAASTTVMNVLYRFALQRNLTVALPRHRNILSETSKHWLSAVVPRPSGVRHFDILCNHLVFNESAVRHIMPSDTLFVGIVRHPLFQFLSAFNYYSDVFQVRYLRQIPSPIHTDGNGSVHMYHKGPVHTYGKGLVHTYGKGPVHTYDEGRIHTYLQAPEKYDMVDFASSFTHNRMSFDYGMGEACLRGDAGCIRDYVNYLNRTFQLVMVSERFDESMVLLKRLLGWRLQDVLYIKNNVFKGNRPVSHDHNLTAVEKDTHRAFNAADYALYEHFTQLFDKKVKAEGEDFGKEVNTYKSLLQEAAAFCANVKEQKANLTVNATAWSGSFEFRASDCGIMTSGEQRLVDFMRSEQLKRYSSLT
ncbi:galactose-3-O-sulfotransferase 2-like [Littorina saxatilis]|uniref:galactose-3-O-sulfotransferase 2-like n=1 Tax=Littorina saxatilis TaxID=31220 RepID=UPI0038B4E631